MKVLYVLRYYPTLSETFVAAEIAGLQERGHQVAVLAIGERADGVYTTPLPDVEVWRPPRGLEAITLVGPSMRAAMTHPGTWSWLLRQGRRRSAARAAWGGERAQAWGAARVHAHFAGEAAEWARLVGDVAGIPYSVTVHAADLFKPRASVERLVQTARPVLTVCQHHLEWIEQRYNAHARVLRCGVDPRRFPLADPGRMRQRSAEEGPLRVICVARYAPKKGIDTLLESLQAATQPMTLHLITDRPPRTLPPGVCAQTLPPSAVPQALAAADVFVLPCRVAPDGDRDGVPVALMEAMAAGLPVISTPVSGVPELVDDTVGWLTPANDVVALAHLLDQVARSPELRAARGLAGRERVAQGWTIDGQVDGLLKHWGEA